MRDNTLTKKQRDILRYIQAQNLINGFQPSMREIGIKFSMTASAIHSHLMYCEKKGYITMSGLSRGIRFLKNV